MRGPRAASRPGLTTRLQSARPQADIALDLLPRSCVMEAMKDTLLCAPSARAAATAVNFDARRPPDTKVRFMNSQAVFLGVRIALAESEFEPTALSRVIADLLGRAALSEPPPLPSPTSYLRRPRRCDGRRARLYHR